MRIFSCSTNIFVVSSIKRANHMATASQDLFVWAERRFLPEATSVFTELGARVRGVPLERPASIPESRFIVVYLRGQESESELHSALRS